MSNNRCKYCSSSKVKKKGLTKAGIQRWFCHKCRRTWSRVRSAYKAYNPDQLFNWWLAGDPIQTIAMHSGLSKSHVQRLLLSRLEQPVNWSQEVLAKCQYAALDGKFLFGRRYTVLILYDVVANLPMASKVVSSENRREITQFLVELKALGFSPKAVTTDGKGTIAQCFRYVFDGIVAQRCLFHIVLQVNAWIRRPPRSPIGWQLHSLVSQLMQVNDHSAVNNFWRQYESIKQTNHTELCRIRSIPDNRQERDLLKCFSLLDNAKPDMFNFLYDNCIASTTSGLEGFNKQIQRIRGFDHNGLTKAHLDMFIRHYIITKWRDTK